MHTDSGAGAINTSSLPDADGASGLSSTARRSPRPGLIALVPALASAVYLADQAGKAWALSTLVPGEYRSVVGDLVRLTLVFNPGAAFSFGTSVTPVFTVIMVIAVVAILAVIPRLGSRWWAVGLGLLMGGALGNLHDRLFRPPSFGYGHVVDFIALPNFPVFNVADSCICTAAAMLAIAAFREVPLRGRPAHSGAAEGGDASGPDRGGERD